MTEFLYTVSLHLSRKRTADSFLQFLTNSSSIIIVFLDEISEAFEASSQSPLPPEDTVKRYLELFPESNLANVLEPRQQRKKLNMAADDILSNFLNQNVSECSVLRTFLREICAGVIFEKTISSFARPEFINSWIVYLLKDGESEIMSAIDAGVEGARNQGVAVPGSSHDLRKPSSDLGNNTELSARSSLNLTKEERKNTDKATEDAVLEAKRLSNMIAAQDTLRKNSSHFPSNHHRGSSSFSETGSSTLRRSSTTGTAAASNNSDTQQKKNDDTRKVSETDDSLSGAISKSPDAKQFPTPLEATKSQSESVITTRSQNATLYGASVSVDDGSRPEDKGVIRSKPTTDYLLQIEPASSRRSGWMVFRRYTDFESLHETLGIVTRLNHIQDFAEKHPVLPPWKGRTKFTLARNLERYLKDALQHELLAESGKMRRFLEKNESLNDDSTRSTAKSGISLPNQSAFENVGKSFLGVLTNANKGMAGGSKAVLDGVSGVFGNVSGGNRKSISQGANSPDKVSEIPNERNTPTPSELELCKDPPLSPRHESRPSYTSDSSGPMGSPRDEKPEPVSDQNEITTALEVLGKEEARDVSSSGAGMEEQDHPNDAWVENRKEEQTQPQPPSIKSNSEVPERKGSQSDVARSQDKPITSDESQIAVELMFAVINESYSLSSAWNIRRTILNAAKSYILRPGSPSVETIRALLQESMIDAHTSDEAIGRYLTKLRQNVLPTKEEYESWPPPSSEAEKESLRKTARKLFVQRGMPQAVMSVMGAAASRESLEKIFDCLQVEVVARGFAFSLLLQALKVVIL